MTVSQRNDVEKRKASSAVVPSYLQCLPESASDLRLRTERVLRVQLLTAGLGEERLRLGPVEVR